MVDEDKINLLFGEIDQFVIDLFNKENPTFLEIDQVFAKFNDKFLREKLVSYIDYYMKSLEQEKLNHFVMRTEALDQNKECNESCYK